MNHALIEQSQDRLLEGCCCVLDIFVGVSRGQNPAGRTHVIHAVETHVELILANQRTGHPLEPVGVGRMKVFAPLASRILCSSLSK